jgi:phosphopantetheinyl transferase
MLVHTISVPLGTIYLATFPKLEILKGKAKRLMEEQMKSNLIEYVFKKPINIHYKDSGAPYLAEFPNLHISLSHSSNLLVLYLSEVQEIGIDLQIIKSGIYEGRSYFINETEELTFDKQLKDDEILLSIWCVKEAMYKQLGGIKNAKNDLTVILNEKMEWICSYNKHEYRFGNQKIEDFLLFYTL